MLGLSSRISLVWQLNTTRQADSWASSTCKQLYFKQLPWAWISIHKNTPNHFQQTKKKSHFTWHLKSKIKGSLYRFQPLNLKQARSMLWEKPAVPLGIAGMWAQSASQLKHRDTATQTLQSGSRSSRHHTPTPAGTLLQRQEVNWETEMIFYTITGSKCSKPLFLNVRLASLSLFTI